ncbi:hypothetical protein BED41_14350 [Cloacibacillus porcorum]|uniref:Uncharacterized protein n=1 Tax=Cloacibacillus porcorum TaxID=1197717 RepID=A0A1B2I898_9BACT|nr:hypothetical protein BED41_14350 [Cloacibacillus porcorum]
MPNRKKIARFQPLDRGTAAAILAVRQRDKRAASRGPPYYLLCAAADGAANHQPKTEKGVKQMEPDSFAGQSKQDQGQSHRQANAADLPEPAKRGLPLHRR